MTTPNRGGSANTSRLGTVIPVDSSQVLTLLNRLRDIPTAARQAGAALQSSIGGQALRDPAAMAALGGRAGASFTPMSGGQNAGVPSGGQGATNAGGSGSGSRGIVAAGAVVGAFAGYRNAHTGSYLGREQVTINATYGQGSTYDSRQAASQRYTGALTNTGYGDVTQGISNLQRMGIVAGSSNERQAISGANFLNQLDPTLGAAGATQLQASMTSVGAYQTARSLGIDARPGGRSSTAQELGAVARRLSPRGDGQYSAAQLATARQQGTPLNGSLQALGVDPDVFVRYVQQQSGGGMSGTVTQAVANKGAAQGRLQTMLDNPFGRGLKAALGIETAGLNAAAGAAGAPGAGELLGGITALGTAMTSLTGAVHLLTTVMVASNTRGLLGGGGVGGGGLGAAGSGLLGAAGRLGSRGTPATVAGSRLKVAGAGAQGAAALGIFAADAFLVPKAVGDLDGYVRQQLGSGPGSNSDTRGRNAVGAKLNAQVEGAKRAVREGRLSNEDFQAYYTTYYSKLAAGIYSDDLGSPAYKQLAQQASDFLASRMHTAGAAPGRRTGSISTTTGIKLADNYDPFNQAPVGDGPGTTAMGASSASTVSAIEKLAASGPADVVTSTVRPGDGTSYHAKGQAVDFAPPSGGSDNNGLLAINKFWAQYGAGLAELIYTGPGGVSIKDGKQVPASFWGAETAAQHHNHVHVAATPESLSKIGAVTPTGAGKGSGAAATGSQGAAPASVSAASTLGLLGTGGLFASAVAGGTPQAVAQVSTVGASTSGHAASASGSSSTNAPGGAPTGDLAHWIAGGLGLINQDSPANRSYVNTIISHESSGNPHAINLTDSNAAAGHPSKGLMQMIDSTFNAWALPGHTDIWAPEDNVAAGVRYAESRYGSLAKVPGIMATAAGKNYVGYATGNWRVMRDEYAKIHKDEMVVPAEHAQAIRDTVSNAQPGGGDSGNHLHLSVTWQTMLATRSDAQAGVDMIWSLMQEKLRDMRVAEGI